MSLPKRRVALMRGLASATVAALSLAPLAARAQLQSYPGAGMAMPQAMLPPGFASGAPGYGVGLGNARSMPAAPMMNSMPMMAPMRTYTPSFGVRPPYRQSYSPAYGYTPRAGASSTEPVSPSEPALSDTRLGIRRRGSGPGFYEDDSSRDTIRPVRPTAGVGVYTGSLPPNRVTAPFRPPTGNGGLRAVAAPSAPITVTNTPGNTYIYAPQAPVTTLGGPSLLGGYYYGGYCDANYGAGTYPSVYSVYTGFPAYIYNPGVVYQTLGTPPAYVTDPLPFSPPQYQVTYNQTNYYVTNEDKAAQIEDGGEPAKQAAHQAFPADSYQAAFADIERAWTDGNLDLIKNHLRSSDTKVSVFLSSKYKYSLASSDFGQITRDAFDRLDTVSFQFTRLRKAENGDVTAFGKHVYRVASSSDKSNNSASDNTVPFDSATPGAADAPSGGEEKTVYVSYTLRHGADGWYITAVDSSTDPLVKEAD